VHGDPPLSRALGHAPPQLARGVEAAAEARVEDAVVEQLPIGPRHLEAEEEDRPRRAHRAQHARTTRRARRDTRTAATEETLQHSGQRASDQAVRAIPERPTRFELSAGFHELGHIRLPDRQRPEPSACEVAPEGGAITGGIAEAEEVGVVRAVDSVVKLTDPSNASNVGVDQARLLELKR
jgi:hypothetical protein